MNGNAMLAELDALLESLAPQHVGEAIERRLDGAAHEYLHTQPALITQWPDFLESVAWSIRFFEVRMLPGTRNIAVEYDRAISNALKMLRDIYGENGAQYAFELARTGKEGGLAKIVSDVAEKLARQWEDSEIRGRISQWWESLRDTDQRLEAARLYVERYGRHYWPSEMVEGGAWRLVSDLPQAIYLHARHLRDIRRPRN